MLVGAITKEVIKQTAKKFALTAGACVAVDFVMETVSAAFRKIKADKKKHELSEIKATGEVYELEQDELDECWDWLRETFRQTLKEKYEKEHDVINGDIIEEGMIG